VPASTPKRPINVVVKRTMEALHKAIIDVLREAMKDAVRSYSRLGSYREMNFAVYGRKGEPRNMCKKNIERMVQGGLSTYYCPGCQR
jgi:formamidopyrimidine-DNA glycosylase